MEIDLEDGVIADVRIEAGCNGNLQGIATLVKGFRVDEVVRKLRGIRCDGKHTSCPDQLSIALTQALAAATQHPDQSQKGGSTDAS